MPLKSGKSDKVKSENIKEVMDSYKRKGSIGTSHPASKAKAQKQAVAIAYSKAREKKANIYLEKIANMIIKQDESIERRKEKINEKFFTRQKLRGC